MKISEQEVDAAMYSYAKYSSIRKALEAALIVRKRLKRERETAKELG